MLANRCETTARQHLQRDDTPRGTLCRLVDHTLPAALNLRQNVIAGNLEGGIPKTAVTVPPLRSSVRLVGISNRGQQHIVCAKPLQSTTTIAAGFQMASNSRAIVRTTLVLIPSAGGKLMQPAIRQAR